MKLKEDYNNLHDEYQLSITKYENDILNLVNETTKFKNTCQVSTKNYEEEDLKLKYE
jgi:hypothetical protein